MSLTKTFKMSDEEYDKKFASLQQYIPFLKSMILQLKDPSKKNREQQLNKLESLLAMITDKKRRLKVETLNKCGDVISKLYSKVNHKHLEQDSSSKGSPLLSPASPSPPREIIKSNPIIIPTERFSKSFGESKLYTEEKSHIPKIDIYNSAGESLRQKSSDVNAIKKPDTSKPPISLEDLKTLEDDVQEKISNASLKELDNLRNKIASQLIMEEMNISHDKNTNSKSGHQKNQSGLIKVAESKNLIKIKTSLQSPPSKTMSTPKSWTLKEAENFGSALSNIDVKLRDSQKKKEDKKGKDDKPKLTDKNKDKEWHSNFNLSGKKSFLEEELKLKRALEKLRKTSNNDSKKEIGGGNVRKTDADSLGKIEKTQRKNEQLLKEFATSNKEDNKSVTNTTNKLQGNDKSTIKRLADKYNPKPRKPATETELNKTLSDSIEKSMKIDPPQIPLLNLANSNSESELPPVLKNIVNPDTTQLINSVVKQLKKNNEIAQTKKPPELSPPPIPAKSSILLSPTDNFISEYAREVHSSSALRNSYENLPSARKSFENPPTPRPCFDNVSGMQRISTPRPSFDNYSTPSYESQRTCFDTQPQTPRSSFDNYPPNPVGSFENHPLEIVANQMQFMPPQNTNFVPPAYGAGPPSTFNVYNQHMHNFNQSSIDNMQTLDYYPPNAPAPSNQYCGAPPILSPEIPHFNEHKSNYGIINQDMYSHNNEEMLWRMDDGNQPWNRDRRYNRTPATYREHKEMKERAGRSESRGPWDSRDRRESTETRDPRLQRESRDPRLNRNMDRAKSRERSVDRDRGKLRETERSRERSVNRNRFRGKSVERDRVREKSVDRERGREKSVDRSCGKSVERGRAREKSMEREKSVDRSREKSVERGRLRERSTDRERCREKSIDRSRGKSVERSRPRERYREKSQCQETKSDRVCSKSELKTDENLISPLNSLYFTKEDKKTGKGYGMQNFRIPKIKKDDTETLNSKETCSEKTSDDDDDDVEIINEYQQEKQLENGNQSEARSNEDVAKKDVSTVKDAAQSEKLNNKVTINESENSKDPKGSVKAAANIIESNSTISHSEVSSTSSTEINKPECSSSTTTETESVPSKPDEQSILAQFFSNLLKSLNEKDKKSALVSLISTVSDSLSPKELSKITKIIQPEKNDSGSENEEKEEPRSENKDPIESNVPAKVSEESAIDTRESEEAVIKPSGKRRCRRISSESPVKEVPAADVSENKPDDVVVSVGERIKSRKRSAAISPKPKKRIRTELDKLHEDIQDMFIRDGVLTATGKRMCRILKQDPEALSPPSVNETSVEGSSRTKKKANSSVKSKQTNTDVGKLKNMRVVLSKLPENKLEEDKVTRRLTRSMTSSEMDENSELEDTAKDGSKKVDSNVDSDSDKDVSEQAEETGSKTRMIKKRRVKRWAVGIIDKKRRKPQPEAEKPTESEKSNESSKLDDICLEPDKNYYFQFGVQRIFTCKLCSYEGRSITSHYKHCHPDSEVLSARFSPETAAKAIADAKENLTEYEKYYNLMKASTKIQFICRFCSFETTVVATTFYDHISSHTGEYRHKCPCCPFSISCGKTLNAHMKKKHKGNDKPVIRKSYNTTVIFGYLCGSCNYVQMERKNLEEHINIYHLQETTVYKINMSTILDSSVVELAKSPLNLSRLSRLNLEEAPEPVEKDETTKKCESTEQVNSNKMKAKPGSKQKKKEIQEESVKDDVENISNKLDESTSTVQETPTIEKEVVSRGHRAAKEKAQEKLKSLAEMTSEFTLTRLDNDEESEKKTCIKANESSESITKLAESSTNKDKKVNESIKLIDETNKSEIKITDTFKKESSVKPVKHEVDLNVFTCKTDMVAENKQIELERLQKMEDINKVIGNRTSLNFVDKLCNRLSQNDMLIKREPLDEVTESLFVQGTNSSPKTMPVLEENKPISSQIVDKPMEHSTPIQKKPVLDITETLSTSFDVTQKNDKTILNMIEKLKGKLGDSANKDIKNDILIDDDCESEGPPPLIHVKELNNIKPIDSLAEVYEAGGLIKIIKTLDSVTFCCLVPPCAFSTSKQSAFEWHCKRTHKPACIGRESTLCESCGIEVKTTSTTNLLENIFDHIITEHADFTIIKAKVENDISNTDKEPEVIERPPSNPKLRIRKLSGDELSITKDINSSLENDDKLSDVSMTEPTISKESTNEDIPMLTDEDNPFPFKIVDVMSLAELEQQQQSPPIQITPPPLTLITKEVPVTKQQLLVKEVRLSATEQKEMKKLPAAMLKFIENSKDLYKCPHFCCSFTTNECDTMEHHLTTHTVEPDMMLPCVYCDMKTPWEHVPLHIDLRHSSSKYGCGYCIYRGYTKEYVFLHHDQEHLSKPYSVIVLPTPTNKKYTLMETKVDMKRLCEPYQCAPSCGAQFLFLNEFRRHLAIHHSHSIFMLCGFPNCNVRVKIDRMSSHWAARHGVCLYQCGYCKGGCFDLKLMYAHLAKYHPDQKVLLFARMLQPLLENVILGYTNEAFKKLRQINTITQNFYFYKDRKISTADTPPYVPLIVTKTPICVEQNVQILNSDEPVSTSTLMQTNTSPSTTSSNVLLSGSVVTSPPLNQTNTVTTPSTPKKILPLIQPPLTSPLKSAAVESLGEINPNISPMKACEESDKDENVAPVEHILLSEESSQTLPNEEHIDIETDPLDLGDSHETCNIYSSDDETDKMKKKFGLLSYQLYRCAFCDYSASNSNLFKKHVIQSLFCKSDDAVAKPYMCVHCKKKFRSPNVLIDHIQCHGILRFTCSLCEYKFPTPHQARNHMKARHNVNQTTLAPLTATKTNIDTDEYIVKPKFIVVDKQLSKEPPKEQTDAAMESENVYMPNELVKIPIRSIFNTNIKCGVCSYATKVRTNLVRHLQFHNSSGEQFVPTSAPVNPVPCLEKNEKMFDKMINLASSSHTGRMGSTPKEKVEKDSESIPEFVPTHTRYACCAQGCQYICPEEANLRHHLIALHNGESSFTCVHCKTGIIPADADGLMKHLKLHGLHLYKCYYCNFVHNQKHKVERHISDVHLDLPSKVVVVRHLDSDPHAEVSNSGTQIVPQPKFSKPWRCCMCKTRSQTQDGIKNHIFEKHELDSQYKCALCSYKTNDIDTFKEHFKNLHNDQAIDIIHVYYKVEESPRDLKDSDNFDTTPLWQRDRPRVRHIRGILVDDSSLSPSKGVKKMKIVPTPNTSVNSSTLTTITLTDTTKTSNNLDLSIESVANGTADILNQKNETSGENEEILDDSIIIIEEESDETDRGLKRSGSELSNIPKIPKFDLFDDILSNDIIEECDPDQKKLIFLFGNFGPPYMKQLKCPKCNSFKTKRVADFILHVLRENKVNRFKCEICEIESLTYPFMYNHVKMNHTVEDIDINIIRLPISPELVIWIQMLIQKQCSIITKNVLPPPEMINGNFQCEYCKKWYGTESDKYEHTLTHWALIPFACSHCGVAAFSKRVIDKHVNKQHLNDVKEVITRSPIVEDELMNRDKLQMQSIPEVQSVLLSALVNTNREPSTSAEDIIIDVDTIPEPKEENTVDGNNLLVVSKMDVNVPRTGDVWACKYCAYLASSEMIIIDHLRCAHDSQPEKFKILNRQMCEETKKDYLGCSYCAEIGSEIAIRQHHLENHGNKLYSPYRFMCLYCNKKCINIAGIKVHNSYSHSGESLKYRDLFNDQEITGEKSFKPKVIAVRGRDIQKLYKCTLCPYKRVFNYNGISNIKAHVRTHFRSYGCGDCNLKFKTKPEVVAHHCKEHSHLEQTFVLDNELETQYTTTLKEVMDQATVVDVESKQKVKNTARKSTSGPSQPLEEYTFYGIPTEKYDLTKIMTSVEVNSMSLNISADKLSKMFNLNPEVIVEDCMTSNLDDDDLES